MADGRLGAMNLNLLAALDAPLAEGSVTRAAARMGVTQSAMSHSLRQLREVLGDPLLVRGPAGMTPTPRAEALREPVRRGLLELSRALSGGEFDPAAARRTFTVSCGDFFAVLLLPALLEVLRREAPGVEELGLETYVRLSHALISPRGSGPTYVDDALAARGLERRIALRVPFFLAAPPIIAGSDLVLTLPRRIAELFARTHPLRILSPPLPLSGFSVHLVWHERDDADPGHRWLRRAMARASESAAGATDAG